MRDPLAAGDMEGLVAMIDEDDFDFPAIVAVDRPRRIEAGNAMLDSEAGARPNLDFIAMGNFDRQAGGEGMPLAGP